MQDLRATSGPETAAEGTLPLLACPMQGGALPVILTTILAVTLIIGALRLRARRHGPDRFWTWVERVGWLAGVVSAVLALTVVVVAVQGDQAVQGRTTTPSPQPELTSTTTTRHEQPYSYLAHSPGPDCDKGSARWEVLRGTVRCAMNGSVFAAEEGDTTVSLSWPGYHFPDAYKIDVVADELNPTTCVSIRVRQHYGLGACAHGDVYITRFEQTSVILAADAFDRPSTYLQLTVRVDGSRLALTAFSTSNPKTIELTAIDDAYPAGEAITLSVHTANTTPPSAVLSAFKFETAK
ncbi:hypothetical protein AB0425_31280 [Actinosynnema sp. NPDC051121]